MEVASFQREFDSMHGSCLLIPVYNVKTIMQLAVGYVLK